MADDKSKKIITANDVASFLTNNPVEMSELLATQPELLAACITAAGTSIKTNDKIDDNNILICCSDGFTISPLIVALYVKKFSKIDNKSIYTILLSKNKNFNLWCDIDLFN